MRRSWALAFPVLLAALASAGCGGGGDKAMAEAQSGLAGIKRGVLDLRFTAGKGEQAGGHDVGFALAGPFDLSGKPGTLPVAKLKFTRLLGTSERSAQFVSTGERAWAVRNGKAVELKAADLQPLRLSASSSKSSSGAAGLDFDSWVRGTPTTTKAGDVERIESDVDAVRVINDVLGLAGQFGAGVGPVQGKAAERLRQAVQRARMTVVVGAKDRLVRQVTVDMAVVAEQAREALGDMAAAHLRLDFKVDRPNQAIGPVSPPR
jgi:hypothetical protein